MPFHVPLQCFSHEKSVSKVNLKKRTLTKTHYVPFSSRILYFRIQWAISSGQGKVLEERNATYRSGVPTSNFEGQEFKAFLKWIMKDYFR